MMHMTHSYVDELISLRAKIAELRARAATLEANFINSPEIHKFSGFRADVLVERTIYDVFDISLLPETVAKDPKYYRAKQVTTVRIEDREEADVFWPALTPVNPVHDLPHRETKN